MDTELIVWERKTHWSHLRSVFTVKFNFYISNLELGYLINYAYS